MARTPLFSLVKRALTRAHAANSQDLPLLQSITSNCSRREFLQGSLKAAAILALPAFVSRCSSSGGNNLDLDNEVARVAIIGGGMAGIHCAFRLKKAGLRARVYEASSRVGGRMFTLRDHFDNSQVAELGGEFIDTDHLAMLSLAQELGVQLDEVSTFNPSGQDEELFFFDGRVISEEEVVTLFRPVAPIMARTVNNSENDEALFARTDAMNIVEWLQNVGHAAPLLVELLRVAYVEEYGLEAEEQSAFNLLYLIGYDEVEPFHIFGSSDERFHVHTGSETLVSKMADQLDGQIVTDTALQAIKEAASGYQLSLIQDGRTIEETFDIVVLALPFSILRQLDIALPLPEDKRFIIDNLGYGTNAKLIGGFRERVWATKHGRSGSVITNNGLQTTWDSARGQQGATGILTNFVGGQRGVECGEGTPEDQYQAILPKIDQIFPETSAAYQKGSAVRMHWPTAPFHLGSYACYRPGQWAYSGIEGERVGNLHFCGEHCSIDFQGYMEGACETGAAVANAIATDLGLIATDQPAAA